MAYLSVADRRRLFIDAAIRVVSKEGVARATTRRIAEEAKAPAASLHYCFETKEELLQAAYDAGTSDGLIIIGRAVTPGMGLPEATATIMRALGEWIRKYPEIQLAQYDLTLWSLRNDASRHLAQRVYRRWIDGCAQLLREARTEAENDVDLEVLARMIIGALDGHVLQWLALGDDEFQAMIEHSISALQTSGVASAASPITA